MDNTPNRGIPYVTEGTLDPAAGLNLSLNVIDALLQTSVISIGDNDPPGAPADGDLHIVGETPTGAWVNQANNLARYVAEGSAWQFFVAGSQVALVLNRDDGGLYKFDEVSSAQGWVAAVASNTITVATTTYGSLPSAASNTGVQYYVTDVGLMVSDGTSWIQLSAISSVWASRGTPLFTGQTKRFTDVGTTGSTMRAVGTSGVNDWRITAPVTLYRSVTQAVAAANTGEQILGSVTLPAGLRTAFSEIRAKAVYGKSGVAVQISPRVRLGASPGATSDTRIEAGASVTSPRQIAKGFAWTFTSATNLRQIGGTNLGTGVFEGNVSITTAYPIEYTVSDADSGAVTFSFSTQMASSAETGELNQVIVEIVP